jgi:hypothetical protein
MSNDLLDKNGVWQGTLKQYYDFAKDIIEDALYNEEDEQFEEANILSFRNKIINFYLTNTNINQKKLEDCISEFCVQLESNLENKDHKLGLLIKIEPKKDSIAKVTIKDTLSVL